MSQDTIILVHRQRGENGKRYGAYRIVGQTELAL